MTQVEQHAVVSTSHKIRFRYRKRQQNNQRNAVFKMSFYETKVCVCKGRGRITYPAAPYI